MSSNLPCCLLIILLILATFDSHGGSDQILSFHVIVTWQSHLVGNHGTIHLLCGSVGPSLFLASWTSYRAHLAAVGPPRCTVSSLIKIWTFFSFYVCLLYFTKWLRVDSNDWNGDTVIRGLKLIWDRGVKWGTSCPPHFWCPWQALMPDMKTLRYKCRC